MVLTVHSQALNFLTSNRKYFNQMIENLKGPSYVSKHSSFSFKLDIVQESTCQQMQSLKLSGVTEQQVGVFALFSFSLQQLAFGINFPLPLP